MKHIIILGFIIILSACKCAKDTHQVKMDDNGAMPVLSTREDSINYFRKKGIDYSVEEKLLPVYKQKLDSLNKK
ncbi:MAG: ETC complex I subunit [Bacteroidetes bacterium]|nr:ETC complex I subunit [Bacteroidota bacterium]